LERRSLFLTGWFVFCHVLMAAASPLYLKGKQHELAYRHEDAVIQYQLSIEAREPRARSAAKDLASILHARGDTQGAIALLEGACHLFEQDDASLANMLRTMRHELEERPASWPRSLLLLPCESSSPLDEQRVKEILASANALKVLNITRVEQNFEVEFQSFSSAKRALSRMQGQDVVVRWALHSEEHARIVASVPSAQNCGSTKRRKARRQRTQKIDSFGTEPGPVPAHGGLGPSDSSTTGTPGGTVGSSPPRSAQQCALDGDRCVATPVRPVSTGDARTLERTRSDTVPDTPSPWPSSLPQVNRCSSPQPGRARRGPLFPAHLHAPQSDHNLWFEEAKRDLNRLRVWHRGLAQWKSALDFAVDQYGCALMEFLSESAPAAYAD